MLNLELVLDCFLEVSVIHVGDLEVGEEIGDDSHEEREIMLEELRDVGISHGSDQHNIF